MICFCVKKVVHAHDHDEDHRDDADVGVGHAGDRQDRVLLGAGHVERRGDRRAEQLGPGRLVGELVRPAVEARRRPGPAGAARGRATRKTGICGRIGRQPASGLTPRSFCSAIIAWLMPCRSLPYCLRSFAISGWSSCIARCDFTCLTNSGKRISRMVTTRNMIDSAQVRPPAGSRKVENSGVPPLHHPGDRGVQPVKQRRTPPAGPARGRRGGSVGTAVAAARRDERRCMCSTSGSASRFRSVRRRRGSGTRSTPPGCQGAHLTSRRSASQLPRAGAVPLDRLGGVGAAGRVEPAPRRQRGADRPRVEADGAPAARAARSSAARAPRRPAAGRGRRPGRGAARPTRRRPPRDGPGRRGRPSAGSRCSSARDDGAQPAGHPVADHRVADGLADHETGPRTGGGGPDGAAAPAARAVRGGSGAPWSAARRAVRTGRPR